ncbi:MAG TPA: rhomboid family intramembrane serine protease [Pirellulaceae bacterium]|nr:rhomboid family intramembrane serine protease [Pirellulaceae bacterium]
MEHSIKQELTGVVAFIAVIWLVFLAEQLPTLNLLALGLTPRTSNGLIGIVTAPFLHLNFQHLLANTVPLLVLLILLAGSKANSWGIVIAITLLGGALLWLVGRPATHVGASGLIFGLMSFLMVSGVRERRFVPLMVAILVGMLYGGSLLAGVVPRFGSSISWDGHLCGAIAGAIVAVLLTQRPSTTADRPSRTLA